MLRAFLFIILLILIFLIYHYATIYNSGRQWKRERKIHKRYLDADNRLKEQEDSTSTEEDYAKEN